MASWVSPSLVLKFPQYVFSIHFLIRSKDPATAGLCTLDGTASAVATAAKRIYEIVGGGA